MEQAKYLPLYLKHRPQSLGDLVGQKSVVKTLTNAIENKRIAHAYLFTGPRGTGKTSSARILAKSLNCEVGETTEPCLKCPSCVSIKDSNCPSVFEIDAASNNSVDDARMLIERAPLVAQGGRYKLYIIDECHMLTKEAFNALLKTIEEPPPNVIFILATTEEHKVPPTILSRCQRLMFRLVNHEELAEHLTSVAQKENIEIEKDALELITRKSGGGLRDALGLLDQASLLARPGEPVSQKDLLVLLGALDEDVLLTLSKGIQHRNGRDVLDAITGLVMQGREPALIAQEMAKHFLNLTKASYVSQSAEATIDAGRFILGSRQYIDGLIEQAKCFERVELTQMVEQLDELEQALKRATQPSMTLEIALLSLCHRHDIESVKQLQSRIDQLEDKLSQGDFSAAPAAHRRPAAEQMPSRPPAPGHETPAGPPPPAARREPPPAAPAPPPVQRQDPPDSPHAQIQQTEATENRPSALASPVEEETESDIVVSSVQTYSPSEDMTARPMDAQQEERADPSEPGAAASSYQPVPAPGQDAPSPARAEQPPPDGSGDMSHSELEELWSDLLDALHKRSIPAYSLVSMHAFPVRFEAQTLTIGVQKEFFQKSIENKTNNIILAYKDLRNDEIRVLVKVMADSGPAKHTPKESPAPNTVDQAPARPPEPGMTPAEALSARFAHELSERPESGRAPQNPPSNSQFHEEDDDGSDSDDEDDRATAHEQAQITVSNNQSNEQPTREALATPLIPDSLDSSKIQEAYRIFEGPGSRMIG